jgi:signal transduction histidine kinase
MLTRANEALRKGLAGLKQLDDLDDFLGEMLRAAADIAAAQTGWVVLLDANAATYRFAAVMSGDGELVPKGEILLQAVPVKAELRAWMTGMSRGATGWPLSPHDPLHSSDARAFHDAQNNQALLNIPMRADGRLNGWIGFGFSRSDAAFGPAHPILEVLSDQMTMAVEFSRLAELKEHTAPAHQQREAARERAADLATANEAIRSSLGQLIRSREPDTFVRFALLEVTKQTHAVAADVFRYSPASHDLRQICAVRNGEVFPDGHPDDPPQFQSGFDAGLSYQRFCEAREGIWWAADAPEANKWPFMVSWNRKMNYGGYGGVALFERSQLMGLLVLAFTDPVSLTEIQSQLVVAMGLQISLALEIADLSGQGELAGFATATEKNEAAELATANRALKRSADRLASHPTTKSYLDAVLLEASLAAQARTAYIYEFDRTGRWLTLTACAIDNEIIDVATDSRLEIARQRVDMENYTDWSTMPQIKSRWIRMESEGAPPFRFLVPWHEQMGHKTAATFPLHIGDKLIGNLLLCFTTEERPTKPKLELCLTLSQHAALAIELNRLSDDAREAAVAHEHEKAARDRAAELSSANTAMQRSIERLSALNDLGEFVIEVLKTVEEVTGAAGSTVFLYNDHTRTARVHAMVLEGKVRDPASDPDLLPFHDPITLAGRELEAWERIFTSSGYLRSNVDDEYHHPDTRAWHRARGHCTIVQFPLRRDRRRIGYLALSFRESLPPVAARLDMVGLLAQQLVLAIETARLGEEAKQAAIVFEREKVTAERTVELARANSSLRTTLDILARESEFSSFLNHVLAEAMKQLEARDGIVFVLNSDSATLSPAYSILDESLETGPIPYLNSSFSASLSGAWASLLRARKPLVFQMGHDEALFVTEIRSWHKARGTQTIIGVPMFLGGEAIGYVCLCLRRDSHAVSAFALDQVQALVQQATLALQLARLANAESKAAISREHEKAASEHAAELAKANDVMKRTGSRLLHASDPDAILPVIVSEACRMIGAAECAMFEYRPERRDLVFMCGVQDGELRATLSGHPFGDLANPLPVETFPAWQELLNRDQPLFEPVTEDTLTSPFVPGYGTTGRSVIMQSVLSIDNQPLGLLSLSFREERQPSQMELETFNTLVQQATLALQIARLSKEAKSRAAEAATFEERNRIAREIHDTLAQSFTGVLMQLQAIDSSRVEHTHDRILLQNATSIARNGLSEARRSVKALRPSELESGSLIDALRLVARLAEQQSGVSVVVNCDASTKFGPEHSAEILRIVQEAITNAVKHARATLITAGCHIEGGSLLLSVADNGVGFKLERKTEGFGLIGMRERAAKIGGELPVSSGSDGTVIRLRIPSSKESS